MIRDIWSLFEIEEKKRKERNQRKEETNNRLNKDRIIRAIRTLFNKKKIITNLKK